MSKDQLEQVRRKLYQNSYVTELVNLSDKNGDFPLFIAAQNGYKKIVEYLVERGADIDKADSRRMWTPLHLALSLGFKYIAKYLIDHKADVNKSDSSGKTPLSIAKRKGFNEIVEMLKAAGAK